MMPADLLDISAFFTVSDGIPIANLMIKSLYEWLFTTQFANSKPASKPNRFQQQKRLHPLNDASRLMRQGVMVNMFAKNAHGLCARQDLLFLTQFTISKPASKPNRS